MLEEIDYQQKAYNVKISTENLDEILYNCAVMHKSVSLQRPKPGFKGACADTGFPHGHWKGHFQVGHRKESEQVSFSDSDQDSPGEL